MNSLDALLSGVRIVDLSMHLSGPYGSMLLADMGADVVKIEPPAGDPMRTMVPFVGGLSVLFASINRNKRSACIDLRNPAGREILLSLVARSDVVYNNYRPGVLERLGLDFESLKAANPKIVLVSLSGYGTTGPKRDWPAYDVAVQGLSGGMSVTGYPGERPVRAGIPLADLGGGVFAMAAVLAGLFWRSVHNEAVSFDMSMLDTQISLLMYWAGIALNSDILPRPQGSGNSNAMPYGAFRCSDGYVTIAIWGESFWPKLCRAINRLDLAEEPRYATNTLRVENREELQNILDAVLATKTRDEWLNILRAGDIPSGPINNVREAMADPQVQARGMRVGIDYDSGSHLEFAGNPFKTVPDRPTPTMPPPFKGQHTEQLLQELGLSSDRIRELAQLGVIMGATKNPVPAPEEPN